MGYHIALLSCIFNSGCLLLSAVSQRRAVGKITESLPGKTNRTVSLPTAVALTLTFLFTNSTHILIGQPFLLHPHKCLSKILIVISRSSYTSRIPLSKRRTKCKVCWQTNCTIGLSRQTLCNLTQTRNLISNIHESPFCRVLLLIIAVTPYLYRGVRKKSVFEPRSLIIEQLLWYPFLQHHPLGRGMSLTGKVSGGILLGGLSSSISVDHDRVSGDRDPPFSSGGKEETPSVSSDIR